MAANPTGTVTFLFTDIENSTQLAREHPETWEAARARHHTILREAIERNNGFVFQIVGDAFCAAFHKAGDALKASLKAQRNLQDEPWDEVTIYVRMGIHTGEAENEGDEYRGYTTLSFVQRLMSAGHGGQILVSNPTENLLREHLPEPISLRAMGMQKFAGVPSPVRVFQVIALDLPTEFPPLRTLANLPNNLPTQLTSFVGREKELADVKRLLYNTHLLTLIGPGGTGKTRLSIQAAGEMLAPYPDGVWFVEFAPILDPLLVPRTTAIAIGLRDEPQRPVMDMLCDYLHEKKLLIILDNCEHLVDACARMADRILHAAPDTRILATSREALGIAGEVTYRVPSLGLPDINHLPPVESLDQYEAVKLFIDRATAAVPAFSVTNNNAPALAHVCHQLDGIPLAIELAAAKIRVLSVEQIAKRLDDRFRLLTGGSRTALERHQTLRAAIDWSYNLLSPTEQVLFQRLSVFVGGWTLEAAESICEGGTVRSDDVLSLLEQLIHKSLVIKEEERGESRYQMLETIRQYAHEKLLAAGEVKDIQDKHLNYFLKLSEQIEPWLQGPRQMEWLNRTHEERDNLRAAMRSALETNVETGMYLSSRLHFFWDVVDSREGARWLTQFLQKPESKLFPHARASALRAQGDFLFDFQQVSEAQAAVEESLELSRSIGDHSGEVDSLILLGHIFTLGPRADLVKAGRLLEQALALAKTLDDIGRQANALRVLGWDHRDYKRAFAYWKEAITLYRQTEDWSRVAGTLSILGYFLLLDGEIDAAEKCLDEANSLFERLNIKKRSSLFSAYGQIALRRGDYERARDYFQMDARISNEIGNRTSYLWARGRWGFAELGAGAITEAIQIFAETAQEFQKAGSRIGVVFTVEGMSSLYAKIEKAKVAARLIGRADRTRQEINEPRPKLEQADRDTVIAACIAKIGEAAFSDAYEDGKKISLDEAVDLAVKSMKEIPETKLQPTMESTSPVILPSQREAEKQKYGGLTTREREVAAQIAQGKSNQAIAAELFVGLKTVEAHVTRILSKLGFTSRAQIAGWAVAKGLARAPRDLDSLARKE